MDKKTKLIAVESVILVFILLITVIILLNNNSKNNDESYYSVSQNKWPDNDFTEDFPVFEGNIYSVLVDNKSTAVFAQDIEQDFVDAYISKFTELGLTFEGNDYPKTIKTNKLFVTLAYDKASKHLSITFTLPEEIKK